MKKGLLILAVSLMALAPVSAPAAVRGYMMVGRPYWGPMYSSYYPGYYSANPTAGEIKLDTKVKDAGVFINGAYAGTTHQNKSMYLRPGSYNLEIREAGSTRYAEKVFVVAGKTLHLRPAL
jgi:hypothetical protein